MSLFKRGNVYWAYVERDGVRHQRSTCTTNRKRAERFEMDFKRELEARGQTPDLRPELAFGLLAAKFLSSAQPKPWHVDRLKMALPYFADIPIGKITKNTAREYREYRHRRRANLSDTTINRDLECIRHILFWAVDEGILASNPLSRAPMVRERRKRRPVLSVSEEDKLLEAASPHLRRIVAMATGTGMRRGELLSQVWEDVALERELLFVTHSKTPEGEAREIPLTRELVALLSAEEKKEGLVFTFNDKPIHRLKTGWAAAIRRATIRYYRFHDLRHTFNTRLMLAGVQQEIRKALMGHSSGEDVNSIYTHVELPAKITAIRKLERWMRQERQKAQANAPSGELPLVPQPNAATATAIQPSSEPKPVRLTEANGFAAGLVLGSDPTAQQNSTEEL